MMRTTLLVVVAATLGIVPGLSQSVNVGEIAGRITDLQLSGLAGTRITVTSEDERREAITNDEGRFAIQSLKLGTYHVTAELAGFAPASATITLLPEGRRAHLEWSSNLAASQRFSG